MDLLQIFFSPLYFNIYSEKQMQLSLNIINSSIMEHEVKKWRCEFPVIFSI